MVPFLCRPLPRELEPLAELALDLRWTWNHTSDRLWRKVDAQAWEMTGNPWWILQSTSQRRLNELASDPQFIKELREINDIFVDCATAPGWFRLRHDENSLKQVAYFSMEYGLGEGLPIYAGGLGILAGDYLKTASDLDIPLVAVGLLFQEGYFRQIIGADGSQLTANPHNDATNLPLRPVMDAIGGWLRVPLELPGRTMYFRVWQAKVGRIWLYLLDSNDPSNSPVDRSLIYKLYDDRPGFRIMQEMALGIAGWRVLEALDLECDVCHLNEGHAAFVVLERACSYMRKTGKPFRTALWATRAGTVFTTHTAVAAGFDVFPADLVRYYIGDYASCSGMPLEGLVSLGQADRSNPDAPFNMAVLATRGSTSVNAVSKLHGQVSRRLFQPLFPRWPESGVPVGHVTNGVHMPTWDSKWADDLWTSATGKGCWGGGLEILTGLMQKLPDEQLWTLRSQCRMELVNRVRERLVHQFQQYGVDEAHLQQLRQILDPGALTLGVARRFASYKRPNLLLHDRERLMRLLSNNDRPVQLSVAGKAHPHDEEGRRLVQEMVQFARQPEVRRRIVFVPDYDIGVAQELIQGIDVWINTPRRPWEACGTSGMKVLVNGGLNLSELDGWWAEAYRPEVGWAIGDRQEHSDPGWDAVEAGQLYGILENEVIPEFYNRDHSGIPRQWLQRIRASISELAPQFSGSRMLTDYVNDVYLPAAARWRDRTSENGRKAEQMTLWEAMIVRRWHEVRLGDLSVTALQNGWSFSMPVYCGEMPADKMTVELFADTNSGKPICIRMSRGNRLSGPANSYLYSVSVVTDRPAEHFTVRVFPDLPGVLVPLEEQHILWQR